MIIHLFLLHVMAKGLRVNIDWKLPFFCNAGGVILTENFQVEG